MVPHEKDGVASTHLTLGCLDRCIAVELCALEVVPHLLLKADHLSKETSYCAVRGGGSFGKVQPPASRSFRRWAESSRPGMAEEEDDEEDDRANRAERSPTHSLAAGRWTLCSGITAIASISISQSGSMSCATCTSVLAG